MIRLLTRSAASKAAEVAKIKSLFSEIVNAERDRRITAGFGFVGYTFQYDGASRSRITGAAIWAGIADTKGAQPGNLRWNGGPVDFTWLSAENIAVPMDASTCFAFAAAAAEHERAHIFAARAIKDAASPAADPADDALWPVVAT